MNNEIPVFTFNTKTKEFSVLGHKFEGVNSIEDFINFIHNLDKENKELNEENFKLSELWLKSQEEKRQLETNRDEAIEYIKHSWRLKFDQIYDVSKDLRGWEAQELLSLLERGKE